MGIEYEDMRTILTYSKEIKNKERLLVLGDAVIHFTPQQYQQLAKEVGVDLKVPPIQLTPFTLGESLGFNHTETLDINGKTTLTVDLTKPLPDELIEKYDCIIDAGVLFWCFEPGTAIKNIYQLCKKDGIIVHITATSGYYGRGYFNIHPRFFRDFYKLNNCRHLISTHRTKFRVKNNLVSKIFHKYFLRNKVVKNKYSDDIFLNKNGLFSYRFQSEYPINGEPDFIPNMFTTLHLYKKEVFNRADPSMPYQLS